MSHHKSAPPLTADQIDDNIEAGKSPEDTPGSNWHIGVDNDEVTEFDTRAKGLDPQAKSPASVILENPDGATFDSMSSMFANASDFVGSDQSQRWQDIGTAMLTAITTFKQDITTLDDKGDWKGKTHDAAMANLTQSLAEPQALVDGIGNLSALLNAFTDTIFQTHWYFKNWNDPYQADLKRWPLHADEVRAGFDSFAKAVITTVYQPNIQEIAAANPAFSSGQQVTVDTPPPDGPPPPDDPPPPPPGDLKTGAPPPPPPDPGGPPPPPNIGDPNLKGAGGPNGGGPNGDGFDPSQLPGGSNADFNALPPPGGPNGDGFDPSQLPGGANGAGVLGNLAGLSNGAGGNSGSGLSGLGSSASGLSGLSGLGSPGGGASGGAPGGAASGASGLGNQLSSALGPASDALKQAESAGQPHGGGAPGGMPGLDPKGLDAAHGAGPGGARAGGGGAGLGGRGLDSSRPAGVPIAGLGKGPALADPAATRLGTPGQTAGAGGLGSGAPPGGGGGGQRGPAGKEHKANKALRRKRNGELVIGEPDAVVAVIGDDGPDTEAPESSVLQGAPPTAAPPARWSAPAASPRRPGAEQLRAELEL